MEVLDSVSYDQYRNIATVDELGLKSKIIFSQEAYLNLVRLINEANRTDTETGCFFVGRTGIKENSKDPYVVYIDYFTSDFMCEDAFVNGGSANPTDQVYKELNNKLKEYERNHKKANVFHFHTHPRKLHYECFSDQDLSLYASMAYDNRNTDAYGILGFPVPNALNSNGLSIVMPTKPEKKDGVGRACFYRFQNMYYCRENEILKIGSFEKLYQGRKYKQNSYGTIVKNSVENSAYNEVCAVGVNPNSGKKINDELVGYIDANGRLCFPDENLNINLGSFKKREDDILK